MTAKSLITRVTAELGKILGLYRSPDCGLLGKRGAAYAQPLFGVTWSAPLLKDYVGADWPAGMRRTRPGKKPRIILFFKRYSHESDAKIYVQRSCRSNASRRAGHWEVQMMKLGEVVSA